MIYIQIIKQKYYTNSTITMFQSDSDPYQAKLRPNCTTQVKTTHCVMVLMGELGDMTILEGEGHAKKLHKPNLACIVDKNVRTFLTLPFAQKTSLFLVFLHAYDFNRGSKNYFVYWMELYMTSQKERMLGSPLMGR